MFELTKCGDNEAKSRWSGSWTVPRLNVVGVGIVDTLITVYYAMRRGAATRNRFFFVQVQCWIFFFGQCIVHCFSLILFMIELQAPD
jgi:hypothetical protein